MNKNYIAPQIESMDVEPEEMMVDSKAMNATLDGDTPVGNGYGGIAPNGLDADSRFFDDFWDDDDEY
jgi:hypothetical protein